MKLFDLHCDTLYRAYTEKSTLFNDEFHISLNKSGYMEKYIQCLAVWIPDEYRNETAVQLFDGCVRKLEEQLAGRHIQRCVTAADLKRVAQDNGTGIILTSQTDCHFQ